jgi:hypothetical protein
MMSLIADSGNSELEKRGDLWIREKNAFLSSSRNIQPDSLLFGLGMKYIPWFVRPFLGFFSNSWMTGEDRTILLFSDKCSSRFLLIISVTRLPKGYI